MHVCSWNRQSPSNISCAAGAGTCRALGLSNELFVLGDSVVLTVLGQVAFMPVLVLAARLCPEVRTCWSPYICAAHFIVDDVSHCSGA